MAALSTNYLYYFDYKDPITRPNKWDRFPLAVILHQDSRSVLCVNLHWLPNNTIRRRFVEFILDNSRRLPPRKLVRMVYSMILGVPMLQIAKESAIRRYLKARMRNVQRITKEELQKIDQKRFPIIRLNRKYRKKIVKRRS